MKFVSGLFKKALGIRILVAGGVGFLGFLVWIFGIASRWSFFFGGFEGPILAGAQWGFHFGFGLVGDFPDLKALWRVIGKPPPSKTTSRPGSNSGFGWFLPLIVDPAGLDKR